MTWGSWSRSRSLTSVLVLFVDWAQSLWKSRTGWGGGHQHSHLKLLSDPCSPLPFWSWSRPHTRLNSMINISELIKSPFSNSAGTGHCTTPPTMQRCGISSALCKLLYLSSSDKAEPPYEICLQGTWRLFYNYIYRLSSRLLPMMTTLIIMCKIIHLPRLFSFIGPEQLQVHVHV